MKVRNKSMGFNQILDSTVGMVASSWKAPFCIFFQLDDQNNLRVKASSGLPQAKWKSLSLHSDKGLMAECMGKDTVVEIKLDPGPDELQNLLKPYLKGKSKKFVLVPVAGQSRVLGALLLGPLPKETTIKDKVNDLRGAGTLCAVLSAHGRLYEWMSKFLPEFNHELRTPLTAVQGSLGMVLGGMFGEVDSEVREMLEMAHKGCARTIQAIEGYLTAQQPPKA